jgi:hypothetical protein
MAIHRDLTMVPSYRLEASAGAAADSANWDAIQGYD